MAAADGRGHLWRGRMVRRLLPFACLYFTFGATLGFLGGGAPILLRERGVALAQVGLLQLIYLPLGLTFTWALVLDRVKLPFLPHRIGWIAAMQLLSTVLLIVLGQGETWPVPLLFAFALAISFAFATMDIALESLVVETVAAAERPRLTTAKLFAASLGSIVGTGLLTAGYGRFGWRASLNGLAVVDAFCLLPMLRYPEAGLRGLAPPLRGVATGVRLRALAGHVVLIGLYFSASSLLFDADSLVLLDLHLSSAQVGLVVGTGGPAINLAMTLVSGALMARFPAERLVLAFAAAAAGSGLLLAVATAIADARLGAAAVLLGLLAASGLGVPVFTMIYRWAQGETPASDYALLFGIGFLAALPARVGGPALAAVWGWPVFLTGATAVYVVALVLLGRAIGQTRAADGSAAIP